MSLFAAPFSLPSPAPAVAHDDGDSDSDMADQPASPYFSGLSASSCTSLDSDNGLAAPQPPPAVPYVSPAPSVYSLTDSIARNTFCHHFQRRMQATSPIYALPADKPEFERLNAQHMLLSFVLGKFPPPLRAVLHNDPAGPQKAVLDLGCGTGAWLSDVATEFPHITALGVDLVPGQLRRVPANVRTEIDDINLGLEHLYGQYDVVNARLISSGINCYGTLIDHAALILRPGGLAIFTECDFEVYDANGIPYPAPYVAPDWAGVAAPTNVPAVAQYMSLLRRVMLSRAGDVNAASHFYYRLHTHPSFTNVVYQNVYLPITPFADPSTRQGNRLHKVGLLARDIMREFLSSGRPAMLLSGIPVQEVDTLIARARAELTQCLPYYTRIHRVYAHRA